MKVKAHNPNIDAKNETYNTSSVIFPVYSHITVQLVRCSLVDYLINIMFYSSHLEYNNNITKFLWIYKHDNYK